MHGPPAPEATLDLLSCNFPRKCTLPKCECMANGLKCTSVCRLLKCESQTAKPDDEESPDGEDEDLDDYDDF